MVKANCRVITRSNNGEAQGFLTLLCVFSENRKMSSWKKSILRRHIIFMGENCLRHNSPSVKIYVTREIIFLPTKLREEKSLYSEK